MIIDRSPIAGLRSYFQLPGTAPAFNFAPGAPIAARTPALGRGQQRDISGIHLLIESADLGPYFTMQGALDRAAAASTVLQPLFSIRTQKEMFPGFWDDPFLHRVHTIAGFDDFKRGVTDNCRAMEIDGVATLVSLGSGACQWTSQIYELPQACTFSAAAWELATSRLTPADSFKYSLKLRSWTTGQDPTSVAPRETDLAPADYKPDQPRAARRSDLVNLARFQVVFSAHVLNDSYMLERHTPVLGQSIGRPLLRAVNLIEPIDGPFRIFTLHELADRCSEYQIFQSPGPEITRLKATVDLSATLVFSERQQVTSTDYEFVEVSVATRAFTSFEARLRGEDLLRLPG
jgi:hypothetical protein